MTGLETERATKQPQPFRILVADDDRGNREALADFLHSRGFETVQAADGDEAVEITRATQVHLLCFDMHMPKMTGLEAWQLIRQMNDLLPAILMTADANRDVMRRALAERVHTVLPKPISPAMAMHAIVTALTKAYGQMAVEQTPNVHRIINVNVNLTLKIYNPNPVNRSRVDEDRPAE
jgi:two-component system, response regulator PdtaR